MQQNDTSNNTLISNLMFPTLLVLISSEGNVSKDLFYVLRN